MIPATLFYAKRQPDSLSGRCLSIIETGNLEGFHHAGRYQLGFTSLSDLAAHSNEA
jgi:hypothetical protein